MLRILTGLADEQPRKKRRSPIAIEIEPHVRYFDIESSEKKQFVLPFQLITLFLFIFIIVGFATWLIWDDNSATMIVLGLQCAFAPFYLPGLYFYSRSLKKETDTEIELDKKYGFIKYTNDSTGQNLMFHESQVEHCEVNLSLLLPYRVDYIFLRLKGGKTIFISSLIVEPNEILKDFSFPYQIKKRWINPLPRKMQSR